MSDRGVAVGFSAFLHLLVLGLMVFTWSSEPELRRPPEIPPHVMATVMEETRRAPEAEASFADLLLRKLGEAEAHVSEAFEGELRAKLDALSLAERQRAADLDRLRERQKRRSRR